MNGLRKPASILALALAGVTASHATRAQSVTEQRPVPAFNAIELSVPYHVVVHAQGAQSVRLVGARQQLAQVETLVRGDTLVVRQAARDGFHFGFHSQPEVTIDISAAMLKSLQTGGSGDVELDQLGGDRVTLASDGPGSLRAAGAVRELIAAATSTWTSWRWRTWT